MKTDVLIIGGGVIGSAIAHQLSKYNLDITLVEKESDVCTGTSKANSSMLHDGYNVDKHKLKGQLVLKADKDVYAKLCKELHVDLNFVGSIVAGFQDSDIEVMNHQMEMANDNGIKGMRMLNHDEMLEMEPNMNPEVKFGLYNPNTGVLNPFELTMGLAENAVLNGTKVLLNTEVTDIIVKDQKIDSVITTNGVFYPKVVINAAGLYSDKIAAMVEEIDFTVKPRKGQYFLFDKQYGDHVKHCIYSAPTEYSKGMIILPTTEGNILAGSNAEMMDDKTDFATTAEALNNIYGTMIHKLFPKLPRMGDVTTTFAGLRAVANTEDFIIAHAKTVRGMINLAGIQSPGLSSAPAIAEMVEGLVREVGEGLDFSEKADYIVGRPKPIILNKLSYEERSQLIAQNPDYGQIICRCESISKGEILDAIRRPIPATCLDAIKRRTRAGMGRCQGGFCGPRVVSILEQELGISPLDATKRGRDSKILAMRAKELALQEGGSHEKIKL
jgi:glycerol-3-phosphate dehydrogenase